MKIGKSAYIQHAFLHAAEIPWKEAFETK